jgi:hypothetical protein
LGSIIKEIIKLPTMQALSEVEQRQISLQIR